MKSGKSPTTASGEAVGEPIHAAGGAIADGDVLGALHVLLGAWRTKKAPAIADAIDALSARITKHLPPIEGAKPPALHAAWIEVARRGHEADVDRLAPALLGEPKNTLDERLSELVARPADPRIATALLAMVQHPPTTAYDRFGMWTFVFDHLLALGDVRVRAPASVIQRDPPPAFAGNWPVLTKKLARFMKALPKLAEPALTDDESVAVDALARAITNAPEGSFVKAAEGLLAKTAAQAASAGRTHEEFLAAIYAAPEDDAPRLVYADWLLEQGDPRGEFIMKQFQDPKVASGAPDVHKKLWIAPIAPLLEGAGFGEWRSCVKFRRGFLSSVMLKQKLSAPRYAEIARHPMLSTLEQVYPRGDSARIIGPGLTALRYASFETFESFARACEMPFELGIERIHVRTEDATPELEARVAAATAPVFTKLRSIRIDLPTTNAEWFLGSWIVRRVKEVISYAGGKGFAKMPVTAWLKTFAAHDNLKQVLFWGPSLLRRTQAGTEVPVLHLSLGDTGEEGDPWIAEVLERLPAEVSAGWHLELGSRKPSAEHEAFAKDLAQRFPGFQHLPLAPHAGQPRTGPDAGESERE
jgi:uncharacterized protein (TIGR02996 family)